MFKWDINLPAAKFTVWCWIVLILEYCGGDYYNVVTVSSLGAPSPLVLTWLKQTVLCVCVSAHMVVETAGQ